MSMESNIRIVNECRERNKLTDDKIRKEIALEHKRYGHYLILCLPKKYRPFFTQVKYFVYTVVIVVPICEIVIYLNK